VAEWSLDKTTNIVSFDVAAKQPATHWTGLAFAPQPTMVFSSLGVLAASLPSSTVLQPLRLRGVWAGRGWCTGRVWSNMVVVLGDSGNANVDLIRFDSLLLRQ